jgi:hypothetical protein
MLPKILVKLSFRYCTVRYLEISVSYPGTVYLVHLLQLWQYCGSGSESGQIRNVKQDLDPDKVISDPGSSVSTTKVRVVLRILEKFHGGSETGSGSEIN